MSTDTARTRAEAYVGSLDYPWEDDPAGREASIMIYMDGAVAQRTADIKLVKDMRDDAIDRRLNRHVYQTFKAVLMALRAQETDR